MKKASNIWVRRGLLLHRLHGQELALALLLKQNRCLLHKFARPFWKKKYALTAKKIENFWKTLNGKLRLSSEDFLNGGELSLTIVVYIAAQCAVLDNCQERYNENQLIDLIGLTQNTVNAQFQIFFIVLCLR